jgi:hypothetical protein
MAGRKVDAAVDLIAQIQGATGLSSQKISRAMDALRAEGKPLTAENIYSRAGGNPSLLGPSREYVPPPEAPQPGMERIQRTPLEERLSVDPVFRQGIEGFSPSVAQRMDAGNVTPDEVLDVYRAGPAGRSNRPLGGRVDEVLRRLQGGPPRPQQSIANQFDAAFQADIMPARPSQPTISDIPYGERAAMNPPRAAQADPMEAFRARFESEGDRLAAQFADDVSFTGGMGQRQPVAPADGGFAPGGPSVEPFSMDVAPPPRTAGSIYAVPRQAAQPIDVGRLPPGTRPRAPEVPRTPAGEPDWERIAAMTASGGIGASAAAVLYGLANEDVAPPQIAADELDPLEQSATPLEMEPESPLPPGFMLPEMAEEDPLEADMMSPEEFGAPQPVTPAALRGDEAMMDIGREEDPNLEASAMPLAPDPTVGTPLHRTPAALRKSLFDIGRREGLSAAEVAAMQPDRFAGLTSDPGWASIQKAVDNRIADHRTRDARRILTAQLGGATPGNYLNAARQAADYMKMTPENQQAFLMERNTNPDIETVFDPRRGVITYSRKQRGAAPLDAVEQARKFEQARALQQGEIDGRKDIAGMEIGARGAEAQAEREARAAEGDKNRDVELQKTATALQTAREQIAAQIEQAAASGNQQLTAQLTRVKADLEAALAATEQRREEAGMRFGNNDAEAKDKAMDFAQRQQDPVARAVGDIKGGVFEAQDAKALLKDMAKSLDTNYLGGTGGDKIPELTKRLMGAPFNLDAEQARRAAIFGINQTRYFFTE